MERHNPLDRRTFWCPPLGMAVLVMGLLATVRVANTNLLPKGRRALLQILDSAAFASDTSDIGAVRTDVRSLASVSNPDGFLAALRNDNITTISLERNIILNSTKVLEVLDSLIPLDLTRNVTVSGRRGSASNNTQGLFYILDFNLTPRIIRLGANIRLEFRALRLAGVYLRLGETPIFAAPNSVGVVAYNSVYIHRTACRTLEDMERAWSSDTTAGKSRGGPENAAFVPGNGTGRERSAGSGDESGGDTRGYPPPEDLSSAIEPQLDDPGSSAIDDWQSLGIDPCSSVFTDIEPVAADCFESQLLPNWTLSIGPAGLGIVRPEKTDWTGPGMSNGLLGPSLRVTFNMTMLVCSVYVRPPCSTQTGDALDECIKKLLAAKNTRPPSPPPMNPPYAPPPLLPSPLPSQPSPSPPLPPPSASPPPAVVQGGGSGLSVSLLAVLLPAILGSFALSGLVVGGVMLWRRRGGRDAGGGGSPLQPHDSDQVLKLPMEASLGGKDGGSGSGKGGGSGGGKGGGFRSPFFSRSSGKGRRGPGNTPVSAASAAGTLSCSQGLSSTLTGLTSTLGASSPNDSAGSDPTRAVTLHQMLGSGSFGRVYLGSWQGQPVAVKIISHSEAANAKVQQEVALCTKFTHPNVVRSLYYTTFETGQGQQASQPESQRVSSVAASAPAPSLQMETWIVLEYCDAGSLASHLNAKAATQASAAPQLPPGASDGPRLYGQESGASGGPPAAVRGGSGLLELPEGSVMPPGQQGQRDAALSHMSAVLSVARDIASGMSYLHSLNVCHGDLKCENVLLSCRAPAAAPTTPEDVPRTSRSSRPIPVSGAEGGSDEGGGVPAATSTESVSESGGKRGPGGAPFVAKVADFGLSKVFTEVSTHMSTATVGTVTHMCPVLLLTGQMRPSCDVFSFGIILWQLATGGTPFAGMRYAEIVYKVSVAGMRPEFPAHVPKRLIAMAEACWAADPTARPTFEQLVGQLEEMLEVANELQAEQDAALTPAKESTARVDDVTVAAFSSEDAVVASQWAAAAAAALLE